MKRLVVIAVDSFVIEAIGSALRQIPGIAVLRQIDGYQSARGELKALSPDVVLVDDMDHGVNTLARLREVKEATPEARSVLLTIRTDSGWLEDVATAGAETIISKAIQPVALGMMLREISRGHLIGLPRHSSVHPTLDSSDCPLTDRELEILNFVAEGQTNNAIAQELWITQQTVKFHLSNVYRKLGVSNRTEASRHALLHGYVNPHQDAGLKVDTSLDHSIGVGLH